VTRSDAVWRMICVQAGSISESLWGGRSSRCPRSAVLALPRWISNSPGVRQSPKQALRVACSVARSVARAAGLQTSQRAP